MNLIRMNLIRKIQALAGRLSGLPSFKPLGLGIIIACGSPLVSQAEPLQAPCIAIQGSLLYFAPSYDETYFVINGSGVDGAGNPTPNGKKINNAVGHNLGFRLEGIYEFCDRCVDFRLRWTHVYATSEKNVIQRSTPAQLWPTETIPSQPNVPEPYSGIASSHIGVMYQKGECLLDEKIWDLCGWQFGLREGVEWSYLRYHETVDYKDNAATQEKIQYHAHTKGLGPQIGVSVLCAPEAFFAWYPRNLLFKFMTTASLIVANSKAKIKMTDILSAYNSVTQSSIWRFVPEWHLNFGINYLGRFLSCRTNFEIGYEITTYYRGTSKLIFDDPSSPGHSFNQYSDFYVHGLYLSSSFIF